jgi:lipopolysaccharide export system permease protein
MIQAVSSIGPREMSSIDVMREIKNKELNLAEKLEERYMGLTNASLQLELVLRKGPTREDWNRRSNLENNFIRESEITMITRKDRSLLLYRLEYYKKFSIPFGAFSFVFLAVPLGLLAKKSGQTVGFFFGIIIAVIYWALLLGGQTMGMRLGYSPFWSMWLPNILAVTIGLFMCILRVRR